MENIIIIGSGPAGHTAAIYTGHALLKPLMFEGFMAGGMAAGGQLTTTTVVENFPGFPNGVNGPKFTEMLREQSLRAGTTIETKTVDKVDLSVRPFKVYSGDEIHEAKALIIATGASAQRMGLPGEEKFRNRGVSACAVCDGGLPIFRNKHIVVIGGGDAALEEAMYLTNYASKVTILVRKDVFRASKMMQEKVFKNEKIEIMFNTEATELLGDAVIKQVKIVNNKTNEEGILDVAGLFYAIGHKPNTDFLEGQLELDASGYIVTKPGTPFTNVEGVFAAGDVQDHTYKQAITAAGSGCMAALQAEKYIQDNQ